MRLRRIGLVLALVGAFVPLILLPLVDSYRKNAGILANIQSMSLPITADREEPDFREVDSLDAPLLLVEYGNTGMIVGFPGTMSNDEIERAIKAEQRFEKKTLPKYMRFYGWRTTYKGVRIPYRYVASGGLILILTGLVVIALRARQAKT
jgi:hypothetical protein